MQVKLYFPGTNSSNWTGDAPGTKGVVRALVKDSNDYYAGQDSITFIDSTGLVSPPPPHTHSEAPGGTPSWTQNYLSSRRWGKNFPPATASPFSRLGMLETKLQHADPLRGKGMGAPFGDQMEP